MSRYAQGTEVSADRSKAEIEKTLMRFGADQFMYGWDLGSSAVVGFRIAGRMVKILLPMPEPDDPMIALTPSGRERSAAQIEQEYAKEVRRRWRSLALVIKAKLTAVEDGISSIEREFMADVVLPNGETVSRWLAPQLEVAYERGQVPQLLPGAARERSGADG